MRQHHKADIGATHGGMSSRRPSERQGQISYTKTADLKPHPLNEKLYGAEAVDPDLLASIESNGILEPLLVARLSFDGANYADYIISGHSRWRVAMQLGVRLERYISSSGAWDCGITYYITKDSGEGKYHVHFRPLTEEQIQNLGQMLVFGTEAGVPKRRGALRRYKNANRIIEAGVNALKQAGEWNEQTDFEEALDWLRKVNTPSTPPKVAVTAPEPVVAAPEVSPATQGTGWTPEEEAEIARLQETEGLSRPEAIRKMRAAVKA